MSTSLRVVFAASIVVLVVAVGAAFTVEPTAAPQGSLPWVDRPLARGPGGSASTSTTSTTAVTAFPALFRGFDVQAVRTPSGLVLPVLGGGAGAWEVRTPCSGSAVVDGMPVYGAHVVLDPGHGGSEPGAVGPSGLLEKDLNLDVARRARDLLEAAGAVVVMTRDADVRLTVQVRGEIAQRLQPPAFVSVHHNAAPTGTSSTPGSEVYHQLADEGSRRLAGLLWEEYQQHLAPFGSAWAVGREPGARARRSLDTGDDYYGVLRNSQGVPAVLSEAAFVSNPAEEALLDTDAFRDAEAQAIADAIIRFQITDDPGSGHLPVLELASPAGGGGGSVGCEDPEL